MMMMHSPYALPAAVSASTYSRRSSIGSDNTAIQSPKVPTHGPKNGAASPNAKPKKNRGTRDDWQRLRYISRTAAKPQEIGVVGQRPLSSDASTASSESSESSFHSTPAAGPATPSAPPMPSYLRQALPAPVTTVVIAPQSPPRTFVSPLAEWAAQGASRRL